MRDLALLRRQAMRAYEVGRLRFAARVALVIIPFAVLCAQETGAYTKTAIIGGTLLLLAVILRWHSRGGVQAVATGLGSGAVPAFAALALCRFAPSCPPEVALGLCAGAGLLSGGIAGRSAMRRTAKARAPWTAAAIIAVLTAALGCIALGLSTVAGAAIGLTLGAVMVVGLQRRVSA